MGWPRQSPAWTSRTTTACWWRAVVIKRCVSGNFNSATVCDVLSSTLNRKFCSFFKIYLYIHPVWVEPASPMKNHGDVSGYLAHRGPQSRRSLSFSKDICIPDIISNIVFCKIFTTTVPQNQWIGRLTFHCRHGGRFIVITNHKVDFFQLVPKISVIGPLVWSLN